MLKKRIIPCFDIKEGRVVKGINFEGLRDAGNPVQLASAYAKAGADELVFLDITATQENRKTLTALVSSIAAEINIPFTVGGGINSVEDAERIIRSGADKISLNSSAVKNPQLITDIAKLFGSQAVVVAIDTKLTDGTWQVYSNGGRVITGLGIADWATKAEQLGAGEILLTSMTNDGTKAGFALEILDNVCNSVNIPVIASGGAGTMQHFYEVFTKTGVSAALAASIFHYGDIDIQQLKDYLKTKNIAIR